MEQEEIRGEPSFIVFFETVTSIKCWIGKNGSINYYILPSSWIIEPNPLHYSKKKVKEI